MTLPSPNDVRRIAAIANPVVRNLQITACYHDLSLAMTRRAGKSANWCTFATWASRQAGQTIRGEDLRAKLRRELQIDNTVGSIFIILGKLARENGAAATVDAIRETTTAHFLQQASARAADAVAYGNRKVFEEIGFHFARFLESCANDEVYSQSSLDAFLSQLKTGDPPDGQQYLRHAFSRYYQAMFETDPVVAAELRFFGNVEIGYHEQTRLQPEIAEALNTATLDADEVTHVVKGIIFPPGVQSSFRRMLMWTLGKLGLIEQQAQRLCNITSTITRKVVTEQLMALTFPPGATLMLGRDVTGNFPASLQVLKQAELLKFLHMIDPTPDSLQQSGATDWAQLNERLHYICDLFRTSHEKPQLFEPAFSPEQLALINAGKVPQQFDW